MKSSPVTRIGLILVAAVFSATTLIAADIPLANWTVPPYHRASSGGLSTMTDITPGVAFVGMQPCRLVDTRPSQGFTGQWGPPIMAANAIRTFDLNSAPHCTGIPAGVEAYSLNFAVTETVGQPGDIRAWPTGTPPVTVTSVLNWNFVGPAAIANSIIIPAGTDGQIDVQVAGFNTHLVIDINGYFTAEFNSGNRFIAITSIDGAATILGVNNSGAAGSHAIGGFQAGLGANSYGVEGQINTNAGAGSAGVHGISNTGPNVTYGGKFENANTANCSAGSFGLSGSAALVCGGHFFLGPSGVLATSSVGPGVLGLSTERGVQGDRTDATGVNVTGGVLGYVGTSGVHSFNDVTAAGVKPFVEPHPRDASKQIKYVALEGNEVGTYFRGRARFQRGLATIEIPEDFRMVTEPEGLSIQITPIGEMASYAVVSIDLDRIVVKGSRNVEFFYTVNGVRHNYADFQPIGENVYFIPAGANDQMIEWPETHRRLLIQNGTLKPDGTINMETAHRLGWDRKWENDQLRIQAEQAADREADRQGVPEGTIKPAVVPD